MTTDEIQASFERFMARITAILTADELALYQAYQQRLEASVGRQDPNPVTILPAEQSVLIGLEKLPQ